LNLIDDLFLKIPILKNCMNDPNGCSFFNEQRCLPSVF
jgi:hypothetical protein